MFYSLAQVCPRRGRIRYKSYTVVSWASTHAVCVGDDARAACWVMVAAGRTGPRRLCRRSSRRGQTASRPAGQRTPQTPRRTTICQHRHAQTAAVGILRLDMESPRKNIDEVMGRSSAQNTYLLYAFSTKKAITFHEIDAGAQIGGIGQGGAGGQAVGVGHSAAASVPSQSPLGVVTTSPPLTAVGGQTGQLPCPRCNQPGISPTITRQSGPAPRCRCRRPRR